MLRKRAVAPAEPPRTFSAYDGADRIGAVTGAGKTWSAFDVHGVGLGTFASVKAAFAAVGESQNRSANCETAARRDNSA